MSSKNIEFKERIIFKPNTKMQLHWYENLETNQKVEFKPKFGHK